MQGISRAQAGRGFHIRPLHSLALSLNGCVNRKDVNHGTHERNKSNRRGKSQE